MCSVIPCVSALLFLLFHISAATSQRVYRQMPAQLRREMAAEIENAQHQIDRCKRLETERLKLEKWRCTKLLMASTTLFGIEPLQDWCRRVMKNKLHMVGFLKYYMTIGNVTEDEMTQLKLGRSLGVRADASSIKWVGDADPKDLEEQLKACRKFDKERLATYKKICKYEFEAAESTAEYSVTYGQPSIPGPGKVEISPYGEDPFNRRFQTLLDPRKTVKAPQSSEASLRSWLESLLGRRQAEISSDAASDDWKRRIQSIRVPKLVRDPSDVMDWCKRIRRVPDDGVGFIEEEVQLSSGPIQPEEWEELKQIHSIGINLLSNMEDES